MLDPTCGSGTTAFVAEQWGRRWITSTRRVWRWLLPAPASWARDIRTTCSPTRQKDCARKPKSAAARSPSEPTHGNVRHGFVYERVPHITLKSIANNAEIDVIYDEHQPKVQAALDRLNAALRGHKTPFR